jgi:Na+-transporting methylmalonyl-CoA/oxaloacetate decarboxylase beta subunit
MLVLQLFQGLYTFFLTEPAIAFGRLLLIALGFLFIFLSYKKILEPLIMLPLGIGMLAVNGGLMVLEAHHLGNLFVNPLASNVEELMYYLQIDFLQPFYTFTFSNGLIACLVFMGIGAITDIDILLARPYMSLFLAVCAELGTILTLPIAIAMGLLPNESAAIALVGGADGPMVLYGSIMLARDLFVPITVVAYVYLGVCYAGYPFLVRIIPRRLRAIEMDWRTIPQVSSRWRLLSSLPSSSAWPSKKRMCSASSNSSPGRCCTARLSFWASPWVPCSAWTSSWTPRSCSCWCWG